MSTKKPMVLVLAGPNGSGKSTITQYFETVGIYTNADEVVAVTGMSNEDAARMVDEKRYASIDIKEDFTFETVLSSRYKLDILEKAKEAGYFIKCIFVLTIDPYVNVARVEARVASGGHGVDREKIIKRYYKSLGNIKRLMELCDILHVYDNTVEPIRIIRKHKEDISIFPNEIWSEEDIRKLIEEAAE
ncbi:MAG: zeta toxin family protein [Lachnospiraceae bacterium]|nr:zeta toxin family protein [Lachnospiraceae bacterium]